MKNGIGKKKISLELFTGAGGLALGIHDMGFNHVGVVEYDKDSCDTLRLNNNNSNGTSTNWPVFEKDVRNFDYSIYSSVELDLLAGGAPCQPFSLGGKHKGHLDSRNMFPEVFRAVRELYPKAIFLENVRGLTRKSFFPYFQYIVDQLSLPDVVIQPNESWQDHHLRIKKELKNCNNDPKRNYEIKWRCYNTADFGVPQQRHRVFIVGFRKDLGAKWVFPEPTHSEEALLYSQYVSRDYWKEHGINPQPVPKRLKKRIDKLAFQPPLLFLNRWQTVRDVISDLPEPIIRDPNPSVANHVGIPDAKIYLGHTGSPLDWPAKAIKAGGHGNPGGENMLRKENGDVRYFTVRELARLQTFPDYWRFANSWSESRRQLGNAVPVVVAKKIASLMMKELTRLETQRDQQYLSGSHPSFLNIGVSYQ